MLILGYILLTIFFLIALAKYIRREGKRNVINGENMIHPLTLKVVQNITDRRGV